jgi:enolase
MSIKISKIKGFEILDSRGNPTVRADVMLSNGVMGTASVPSGASTGIYEAHELRDAQSPRYYGKGVKKAVDNINKVISPALSELCCAEQYRVDEKMIEIDGTENKSNLGANAVLAVSLATAKAISASYQMPLYRYLGGIYANILPVPMMNILNGGAHASNNVDIQEFMIMPVNACSFSEALRMCCEIYHTLGKILKSKGLSTAVGDEGGFAPDLSSDEEAIEVIINAISKAGYTTDNIKIALDSASSEWYQNNGTYKLPKRNIMYTTAELIDYWEKLCSKYPIYSIEDALGEKDWNGFTKLTEKLGDKIQIVGDDLFVTNPKHIKRGIKEKAGNAVLVKYNQIGTLSEAINAVRTAQLNGYKTVISHRSGETEETFIADLAVAVNAGQIKTGAPCRTDRTAKYNRLLRIESELYKSEYGIRL